MQETERWIQDAGRFGSGVAPASRTSLGGQAARAGESTVYVSPSGNDAWSGTLADANAQKTDGPVATLEKARDLVRAVKARQGDKARPIHVDLRGGVYFLESAPDAQRGGFGHAASPNRVVVLWARTSHVERWAADHRLDEGHGERSPGVGGETRRRRRSPFLPRTVAQWPAADSRRWPHQGTLAVVGLSDNEKHDNWFQGSNQFRYAKDDLKAWPASADGEAIVANRWAESHLPIQSIDEKEHVVHFTKRSVFLLDAGDRYWVENVRELLTEPGEFYVDAREKTVYLIPPAGVDPNQAQIIAPRAAASASAGRRPRRRKVHPVCNLPGHRFLEHRVVLRPDNHRSTSRRETRRQ